MRVAIAGAGAVGRSVAAELLENGHEVLLIDKDPRAIKADTVPDAEWLLADACELSSLDEAALQRCDVVIASTGDDKANLVISLLAKTEFAGPTHVGRSTIPSNEWLFNESWGVDVSVSTPRIMSALVEEAVTSATCRLFTFKQGEANMVELTLPDDSPFRGHLDPRVPWPADASIVRCCARATCTRPTRTRRSRLTTNCCSWPPRTPNPTSSSCSRPTRTTATPDD
jgi:trk system potassium uptake protein TrkA